MAKRIFAAFLTMIMVITMSFCVIAEGETTALTIENIYGTKSTLYVDMSEAVTISAEGDVTATVGGGTESSYTASVTVDGEAESGKRLAVAVSPELSLDGMYVLTLNVGGTEVKQSFKYKTLLSETFDSQASAAEQIYLSSYNGVDQWEVTEEGYLHRKGMPCYPTVLKSGIADSTWTDYTVEYDYISDKLCSYDECADQYNVDETTGDATYKYSSVNVMFKTDFYISSGQDWLIDTITDRAGARVSNKADFQYSYLVDGTKTLGTASPVTDGGMGSVGTQTVRYSASMFGKSVYTNVNDNGTEIYSSYAEAPADAELSYTSGGFGIACALSDWQDAHTYIDNLVCYKLERIELNNYTDSEKVSEYYGSKNKLIFKFANDVVNAEATVLNTVQQQMKW